MNRHITSCFIVNSNELDSSVNLFSLVSLLRFSLCCSLSSNKYGSLCGYLIGILLRLLAGEALLNIPPILKYPLFDEANEIQKFPFRTMNTLTCVLVIVGVFWMKIFFFEPEILNNKWDVFKCASKSKEDILENDFIKNPDLTKNLLT